MRLALGPLFVLIILVSLVLGCQESEPVIVELPELGRAPTYVVGVVDGTSGTVIHLIGGRLEDVTRVELGERRAGRFLIVGGYAQTLDALGLVAGKIPAGKPCDRSCALLRPLRVLSAGSLGPIDSSHWKPRVALPEAMIQALVPDGAERCARCFPLEKEQIELPIHTVIRVKISETSDDGRFVLVGTQRGALFRVYEDRTIEVVCKESDLGVDDGLLLDNELWTLEGWRLNRLFLDEQDPEAPCTARTSTAPRGLANRMGAIDGGPGEIYVLSERSVYRFGEAGWTFLGEVESTPEESGAESITWLGPGRAVAARGGPAVLRIEGADTYMEWVGDEREHIEALANIPKFGLIAAFDLGKIARWDAERSRWTTVMLPALYSPGAMVPFDGGMLLTFEQGAFLRYYEEETCEPESGFTAEQVHHSANLGAGVVFGDIISDDDIRSAVGYVTPQAICDQ